MVGVLRKMSALFAHGFRRGGHPVGPEHPRRQAETMRPVLRVRPQGREPFSIPAGPAPMLASYRSRSKGSPDASVRLRGVAMLPVLRENEGTGNSGAC